MATRAELMANVCNEDYYSEEWIEEQVIRTKVYKPLNLSIRKGRFFKSYTNSDEPPDFWDDIPDDGWQELTVFQGTLNLRVFFINRDEDTRPDSVTPPASSMQTSPSTHDLLPVGDTEAVDDGKQANPNELDQSGNAPSTEMTASVNILARDDKAVRVKPRTEPEPPSLPPPRPLPRRPRKTTINVPEGANTKPPDGHEPYFMMSIYVFRDHFEEQVKSLGFEFRLWTIDEPREVFLYRVMQGIGPAMAVHKAYCWHTAYNFLVVT